MHTPDASLSERRNQVLGTGAQLFYQEPLTIVRGDGVWLFNEHGDRFLDMYNNVPCIGHAHPHHVDKVSAQLWTLNVHNRYLHEEILRYGDRLTRTHHEDIQSVVFSCSGTEANEVALMIARAATGGIGIVCTDTAYHGNSHEVRQLSRPKDNPRVRSIEFPESYRCEANDPTQYFLNQLIQRIEEFEKDNIPFAGLLICSLCANEGLPNIPDGFMRAASEIVREHGGLVIADEVQAGLGRSGNWWGYELSGFKPDIVSMGKPLGGGVPLAATAASRELVETFRKSTHYFNTFASSPMQAAAGNAVLDIFEEEQLVSSAHSVGNRLVTKLRDMLESHPNVGDIRSKGLFIAIEWVESRENRKPDRRGAVQVVNRLKDLGCLIGNAGAYGNVLKIRPPLVYKDDHADIFLDALAKAL